MKGAEGKDGGKIRKLEQRGDKEIRKGNDRRRGEGRGDDRRRREERGEEMERGLERRGDDYV